MNLTQLVNIESNPVPTKPARFFDYQVMPYKIVGFYKDNTSDILYGVDDTNQLRKSVDGGKTWGNILFTFPTKVSNAGGIYVSGALLVWLDSGDLYRSIDDRTFTIVLSGLKTPLTSCIDYDKNNPSKVMFAEYFAGTNQNLHVYYSSNAGETWTQVLTKNNPADIRHFHSVDYIPGVTGASEWIVTSGDSGAHVKWWRSTNDGTTWDHVAGGFPSTEGNDQAFRALGVRKISPETYMWIGDTHYENYIFACEKENLDLNNKGSLTEIRRTHALGGQGWGLSGGKHWMVAVDKVEPTSNNGEQISRVMVSGDSGGSWYSEFEIIGKPDSYDGIYGVLGPDKYGQFYVQVNGSLDIGRKTIRLTPRKNIGYPSKPINQAVNMSEYKKVLHDKITGISASSSIWSQKLNKSVYNPMLEVINNTDISIVITISSRAGVYTDTSGNSQTIEVASGKRILLDDGYLKQMLPREFRVGVRGVTKDSTSGTATIVLYGQAYQAVDHRALI